MKFFMIAPYYVYWHYTQGLHDLFKNLYNFIIFEIHFFSVKELVLTLFSPFQRLKENYTRSIIDFESIASTFVVNVVMRVIGFIIRSGILLLASIALFLSLLVIPIILILWLVLPFLLFVFVLGAVWAYLKYRV